MAFESAVNQIAGVVTVGLFALRRADILIVAGDDAVKTLICRARSLSD
jgi:ribose 5-phosphate isomerase A